MKKLLISLFSIVFCTICTFAVEKNNVSFGNNFTSFNRNTATLFASSEDDLDEVVNEAREETSSNKSDKASNKGEKKSKKGSSKNKYVAGKVIGSVGAGLFATFWTIHLLCALIAPPVVCEETGGYLGSENLCLGIMFSSWVPIFGPFMAAGFTFGMINNSNYTFSGSDLTLAGVGTWCIFEGLFEIAFMAMTIVGFCVAAHNKNYDKVAKILNSKVTPIVGSAINNNNEYCSSLGLKIKI